jgi:hypothetical protein
VSGDEMTAWLRAQVEADKAAAEAATPGEWAALDDGVMSIEDEDQWPVGVTQSRRDREDRVHIAIHDPRDVVADCDAKLAILGRYERQAAKYGENCMEEDRAWILASVVRLLASGYRHRDGWQEGWLT